MTTENTPREFVHFLTADQDFIQPDASNDQVWELGIGTNTPRALSISTSYGLRAKRMHVFPRFSLGDTFVIDPEEYHSFPVVQFSSTNFLTLSFKPFISLDALLRVWVPDSQSICGQLCLTNLGEKTLIVRLDWLSLLTAFPGGTPMNPVQMGINKVLQGSTSGVFPVFYMTGGPEESDSPYPGLKVQIVLSPGVTRQVTWVLASRESAEASFSLARHYSSKLLENEQLTVEMRDRKKFLEIKSSNIPHPQNFRESQIQASQLVMPPVNKFTFPTFLTERTIDTGNNANLTVLDSTPGWSGQTLMDTWLMMENLLPANPEIVQGFIENHLMAVDGSGGVDMLANCNLRRSGFLAPPMLNWLIHELQPYQKADEWLKIILPQLEAFLSQWIQFQGEGLDPLIKGWSHPAQMGIDVLLQPVGGDPGYFPALNSPDDLLLLSLLAREIESYLELAHRCEPYQDFEKYEYMLKWLRTKLDDRIQGSLSSAVKKPSEKTGTAETPISFGNNQQAPINRSFQHPTTLNIKVIANQPLTEEFCCTLNGESLNGKTTEEINAKSIAWIGVIGFFTTRNNYIKLNSIKLKGWPAVNEGWVIANDLHPGTIMQFLPMCAGAFSQEKVGSLLESQPLEQFHSPGGLSFRPFTLPGEVQIIPSFLAGMIIEGLLRYGKNNEARIAFEDHFLQVADREKAGTIASLIPLKLYLKLLGIPKLTLKEIVLTGFLNNSNPVTVQYNKIKLTLTQEHVEIDLGAEGRFTVNTPGPQRILLA